MTTVKMYNIPFHLTVGNVMYTLNEHGFKGTYDFVQMPPARTKAQLSKGDNNVGYAFITLKTSHSAAEFLRIFQDFSFPNCHSEKLTCSQLTGKLTCSQPAP